MIKKVLITCAFMFITIGAFSQKIKVISGSIDFLKNEKSITSVFTYNSMQVGGMLEEDYLKKKTEEYNKKEEGKGDKWLVLWTADRAERFEPKFIELYNEHISNKNGAVIGEEGKYVMTVNTHFTEPGFNVAVARRNAAVSLSCKFTDKETGEEIAHLTVTNASANSFWGGDFDTGYRIQESYAKAGRELAKFFIKQLKLK